MSAWERSRHIPWDRIPSEGTNLEEQRERIFRELQKEAVEAELLSQERHGSSPSTTTTGDLLHNNKIPYSNMELLRQAAFGATIGSITGAVFGFLDGMRTAGESPVLIHASNAAKGRYLLQGTTRSAALFGGFFGGFHIVKYGIRVLADPGDVTEIVVAGAVSVGALTYRPAFRASMPYAFMLIFMDGVNLVMKRTRTD